jgi:hypothetical protein
MRAKMEQPYKTRLRSNLVKINSQLGANVSSMVPIWDAVLSMREMVVKGQLPGVAKQSALFADNLGHPQKPLKDMASYSESRADLTSMQFPF